MHYFIVFKRPLQIISVVEAGPFVMVVVIPEGILNFFPIGYIDDNTFKSLHFVIPVEDAFRQFKDPFAFSTEGRDLIFVLKRQPLGKDTFPLLEQGIAIFRRYDIVEGEIPVVDKAFRRISGQFHTAVGGIPHRPVRIVIAPVCHSGNMGKKNCLAAFTLRQ